MNDSGLTITSKHDNILNEYLGYYFLNIQSNIYNLSRGAGQKNLQIDSFKFIKIPIPTLEKQKEIVKFLDSLFTEKYNLQSFTEYYGNGDLFKILLDEKYSTFKNLVEWYFQSEQMRQQIDFYKNNKIKYLDLVEETLKKSECKELGEVCEINIGGTPLRNNSDYWNNGNNIWVSIRELNNNIITDSKEKISDLGVRESNVKLIPKNTILFSFKLSIGKIAISGCELYTNEAIAGLIVKEDIVIMKYLYYILQDIKTFKSNGCIGGGSLNKQSLSEIKLPIPTLEKQKEIVKRLDSYNDIIKQIEKEIENNKITAHTFLQDIITNIEKEQTERVKEEDEDILLIETEEVVPTVKPKLKLKVKKQEISSDEDDSISVSESSSSSSPSCKHIYKDGRKCETTPKKNPNYCSKHCK